MMPQEQDPKDAQMGQLVDSIMQTCQQLKDMMAADETSEPQEQGGQQMPDQNFVKQLMAQQGQ